MTLELYERPTRPYPRRRYSHQRHARERDLLRVRKAAIRALPEGQLRQQLDEAARRQFPTRWDSIVLEVGP